MSELPLNLYSAENVRSMDRYAIDMLGIPGITLMERAGSFTFTQLKKYWPNYGSVAVFCGSGNNAGDGYVIARLALLEGYKVDVYQLGDEKKIKGDALIAYQSMVATGLSPRMFPPSSGLRDTVVVDALLGTGLSGAIEGIWRQAVEFINDSGCPVLAVDIPSGLHANSGCILGVCIKADVTAAFVGLKQGMFTADGPDCCGKILFHALGIPESVSAEIQADSRRIAGGIIRELLGTRKKNTNKKHYGHVLVVGGDHGMSGAARIAGEAAARTGSGLVSVASRQSHVQYLNLRMPELMCHAVEEADQLVPLLERATVVVLGPGLGKSPWSEKMFDIVMRCGKPVVVDADALNLSARKPQQNPNQVCTPHPGEAARLLGCTTDEIQEDRFASVRKLQAKYQGVVVLKGNGTLVCSDSDNITLCDFGNPGMASGGMGDALSGIIGGCIAQGLDLTLAAQAGVVIHAKAGDLAALQGERGLLATDLVENIRNIVNSGRFQQD